MWWWIAIVAALTAAVVLVLASPLTVQMYMRRSGEDDHISVRVRGLYGLLRYRYELPIVLGNWLEGLLVKQEQGGNLMHEQISESYPLRSIFNGFRDMNAVLRGADGLIDLIKQMMRKTTCTAFRWNTYIGLDDAAGTAISVGSAWACKSVLLSIVFRMIRLKAQPIVMVNPQYNQRMFRTEAQIRLSVPLGMLLWLGGRMYICIRKDGSSREALRRMLVRNTAPSPAK